MPYVSNRKISTRADKHELQDRRNDKWNMFYQDRRWKKLRKWYITEHPLCADCAISGRSVPADEVHHKVAFSTGDTIEDKFALLLDPDNLVSLCTTCHMKRHNKLKDR